MELTLFIVQQRYNSPMHPMPASRWLRLLRGYALAVLVTLAVTIPLYPLRQQLNATTIALLYLLPVTLSTTLWGLGPGLISGFLAFLLYNYYFLKPYHTLIVHQPQDITALAIFFVVAVVISQLVGRARENLAQARTSERETTRLYDLSLALGGVNNDREIGKILAAHALETFLAEYVEVHIAANGDLSSLNIQEPSGMLKPVESPLVSRPLETTRRLLGVIYLWRQQAPLTGTEERMLRTYATQGALSLERATLAQAETKARILEESDRLKTALLSSVSHELRTPLATIKASVTSLMGGDVDWESQARQDLSFHRFAPAKLCYPHRGRRGTSAVG